PPPSSPVTSSPRAPRRASAWPVRRSATCATATSSTSRSNGSAPSPTPSRPSEREDESMSTVENSAATSAVSSRVLRLTLLFAFLATVFDGVELNLLSYPLVYISGTFGVSTQAVVGAITAQGLASLVGGFLFGWMGDVLGRRKASALCVFVYGIGALLAGLVTSYPLFLVTRVVSGVGI